MRKLFITSLFIIGFSIATLAQKKDDVEMGVNIGFNSAKVSTINGQNSNPRTGINLGFSTDYYFSDRWSIKGKLIYDSKGWTNGFIEDLSTGKIYKTNFNLDYLTIPVMANWHFGKTRAWYLHFGAYTGILLNAKETVGNTDVRKGFNANDFGLSLGIGCKIPISDKLKLVLEYDSQKGLKDIFKKNTGDMITNSRGSFNAGFNFLLK
ncbi:porin family protein [Flavobacterium psychrotolerans]|uniref:Outer membrane protein beta-barrel domain-containing protein n=1 Tax=Flavobacterium psychrotolerans TaxID=2169410 RepID=A0A2U1JQ56_9FLAO|nr:porin family protein [Flavobacterium psychrotolerans]PWA07316.1 hypothetical protein DB895_00925 [Flavobacterium psychrotolerans]